MDGGGAELDNPLDPVGASAGQGSPRLVLDGFDGPLAHRGRLARAQQVDLGRLSLIALLER